MRMIRASGRNSPVKKRANLGQAKRLSAWSVLALPLIWANGCTEPFESCVPTRTCPPTGGAGTGAEAGEGGSLDHDPSSGGLGGSSGGRGGTAGNQELSGGAGKGPSSANQAGESSGGAAGAFERSGGANAGAEFGGSAGELSGGAFTGGEPSSVGASGQGGDGDVTDYCSPNPCQNGGLCQNTTAAYKCTCTSEYAGTTCSLKTFEQLDFSPFAISGDGSLIGGGRSVALSDGSSPIHSYVWDSDTRLGMLLGAADSSVAYGANADGSVVVGRLDESPSSSIAYRWTQADGMKKLGGREAFDVSDDGSVVLGFVASGTYGGYFRWTAATGVEELTPMTGATNCTAKAISGDGSTIVGYCSFADFSSRPFLWTASVSVMQEIGLPSGCTSGGASDVNRDGSVVVGDCNNASSNGGRAFRWTKSKGAEDLNFVGAASSIKMGGAQLVSRDGSIVVGGDKNGYVFNWDKDHGAREDLDELMKSAGITSAQTQLMGMSADGKTVVGSTRGGYHWLARLP